MQLSAEVEVTEKTLPVCLPTPGSDLGGRAADGEKPMATITGWGKLQSNAQELQPR